MRKVSINNYISNYINIILMATRVNVERPASTLFSPHSAWSKKGHLFHTLCFLLPPLSHHLHPVLVFLFFPHHSIIIIHHIANHKILFCIPNWTGVTPIFPCLHLTLPILAFSHNKVWWLEHHRDLCLVTWSSLPMAFPIILVPKMLNSLYSSTCLLPR